MPTYFPLQTKVQLLISNLADTTTSAPERQKGSSMTKAIERAASTIKNGRILKESSIPCCGDHSRLHFLGPKGQIPFFLVHAGEDLFQAPRERTIAERAQALLQRLQLTESATRHRQPVQTSMSSISTLTSLDSDDLYSETEDQHNEDAIAMPNSSSFRIHSATSSQYALNVRKNRSSPSKTHISPAETPNILAEPSAAPTNLHSFRRGSGQTAAQDPALTPKALGLHLSLSEKSFVRSLDNNVMQDVKIDVFLNGEFGECIMVSARHAGQNKSKEAQARMFQLISGKRVHRLVERAWVIVPPHQNSDGSMRERDRSKEGLAGPRERWDQINASILEEADKLGFSSKDERTPLGAYLASLAELQMPEAVDRLQKAGGPKFGVIDVVVSIGTGQKVGPDQPYITTPTRLQDKDFKPRLKQRTESGSANQSQRDYIATNTADAGACEGGMMKLSRHLAPALDQSVPSTAPAMSSKYSNNRKEPDLPKSEESTPKPVANLPVRPQTPPNVCVEEKKTNMVYIPGSHAPTGALTTPVVFPAFESPSQYVGSSSPANGHHRIVYTHPKQSVGNNELKTVLGSSFGSSSAFPLSPRSMLPQQTPLFTSSKRRRSDAIQLSEEKFTFKHLRGVSSPKSSLTSAKPVLRLVGMTPRGRFAITKREEPEAITPTTSPIRRIIIKNQGRIVLDKNFSIPIVTSSPHYPLDESLLFTHQNFISPIPSLQPLKPQPSSSPTRHPRHFRSSFPRKLGATRTSKDRRQRPKTDQIDVASEVNATWRMPELSKDCVVSFAEDGTWTTGLPKDKGGVWRQIKSSRSGVFKESEVLFAVRYLIG